MRKELQKMNRKELLELLIMQSKENDHLKAELAEAKQMLAERRLKIKHTGSIAEAALQINNVFEAAQNAADQYMENIKIYQDQLCKLMAEESARKYNEQISAAKKRCQALEYETARKCASMVADAKQQADAFIHKTERASAQNKTSSAESFKKD